jgi:hypothetical protein
VAADKIDDSELDEDLFDFAPISHLASEMEDEDADLDDIFAAFQVEEDSQTMALGIGGVPKSAADNFQGLDDDIYDDLAEMPPPSAPSEESEEKQSESDAEMTPAAPAPAPATNAPQQAHAPSSVAAPAPDHAPAAIQQLLPTGSASLSHSALWILLAAMSLNGLIALVMVSSTSNLRNEMNDISDEVEGTIRDIRSEYFEQQALYYDESSPLAAPSPENHPAFVRALEEIKSGAYSPARQRLYALLAVIDRLDPAIREKIEARASYLIGHAWQLEALERMESEALEDNQ